MALNYKNSQDDLVYASLTMKQHNVHNTCPATSLFVDTMLAQHGDRLGLIAKKLEGCDNAANRTFNSSYDTTLHYTHTPV